MSRLSARKNLQVALGLIVAVGIAATRTEKLLAEMQASLLQGRDVAISLAGHGMPEPFDPARVPQSGGMASRLLAGIGATVLKA